MNGGLGRVAIAALLLAVGLEACTAGGARPETEAPSDAGMGGSLGGAPGGASGGADDDEPSMIRLPFAVDDHYVAYGFMGTVEEGAVVSDPNKCLGRLDGAQGDCHHYEYLGSTVVDAWAGLYWLTTFDNWGQAPGHSIEAGVRRVSFSAASVPPGAPVQFLVGGIESDLAYQDSFSRTYLPALTEEYTRHTIDLVGVEYEEGVLGAFGWVIRSGDPYTLYIDDVRWE